MPEVVNPPTKFKSQKKSKSIIKQMDTLEFTEKVNVLNAKLILRMSTLDIITHIYDDGEPDQRGNKWSDADRNRYIKQVHNFCKLAVANNGIMKQKYKYAKSFPYQNVGRIFVSGFGIQSLQHKLRGFLGGEYSHDIDMVNAHPTILVYLVDTYYNDLDIPNLRKYVRKRNELLEKYKTTKLDIIKCLNRDFNYNGQNTLLKCLDRDFKIIQNALYEDTSNEITSAVDSAKITSTNKKGSFLNRCCTIIENNILQKVITEFRGKVSVPYYDGAWFDNDMKPDYIVDECNTISKDYGIKWAHKEHSTFANIDEYDEDLALDDIDDKKEEQLYGYEYIDYCDLKAKFEKNHAIIQIPFMIVKEYEDFYDYDNISKKTMKYEIFSEANLKQLYGNLYYQIKVKTIVNKKTGETIDSIDNKPFLKDWLVDATRRTLTKIDFIPHNHTDNFKIPKTIYNSFTGFNAKYPKEDKEVGHGVKLFLDHLNLLVGHEIDSYNYLINYIADMLQNPHKLPGVALLFKSKQGLGKDLMINYLEKIIGETYVYRTSNLDEVFGNFNVGVKNKLLLQLNELEGKNGFSNKERLKDIITALSLNINEKNVKQYIIRNCIRPVMFTNNIQPIDIPSDDRRFVVFQGGDLINPKDRPDYYNPLFNNVSNSDIINALYKFFMDVDISDFNLKQQRPITSAYKDMREQGTPPIYKFINELITNPKYETSLKNHPNTDSSVIKTTVLHNKFKIYYDQVFKSDVILNFKVIKPLLNAINIKMMRFREEGVRSEYYVINKKNVLELLDNDYHISDDDDDILDLD